MNQATPKLSARLMSLIGALAAVALLSTGILAGSLLTRPAAAAGPGATPDHVITVSGNGEVKVQPDKAVINFQIHVTGKTADEALAAYEQAAAALTARLKELGLLDGDIILQPASTWPVPAVDGSGRMIAGDAESYYTDGIISVNLNDLATLREVVMEGLKSAQGIGLSYIQYGLKDDTAARDQALDKALVSARSQADAAAAKLGLTVKEVVSLVVNPGYAGPVDYYGRGAAAGVADPTMPNFAEIGTRPDIVVNSSVMISYNFE